MSVLLLRLAGPMQSWGTRSRFEQRDTGLEPSKSGVVGLLACALGRPRTADIGDLAALRMGVRVDGEGFLEADYHTAQHVRIVSDDGRPAYRDTVVTVRQYLAGAAFLVGLEGPHDLLNAAQRALRDPRWPLFLGRRAFVPAVSIALPDEPPLGPGLRETDLLGALRGYPWSAATEGARPAAAKDGALRFVLETDDPDAEGMRMDQPLGDSFSTRTFAPRRVRTVFLTLEAMS